ncbi:MAG: hypothetical protein WD906_03520 [Anaerolineales bacterium]
MSRSLEIFLLGRFEVRVDPADQTAHWRRLSALREKVGEIEFESAWSQGVKLTVTDLLEFADETAPSARGFQPTP